MMMIFTVSNDTWKVWLSHSRCSWIFRHELNTAGVKIKWDAYKEREFSKIMWDFWKREIGGENVIRYLKELVSWASWNFQSFQQRMKHGKPEGLHMTHTLEKKKGVVMVCLFIQLFPLYKLPGKTITYPIVSLSLGFPWSRPWDEHYMQ